jgi:hypothetical protein
LKPTLNWCEPVMYENAPDHGRVERGDVTGIAGLQGHVAPTLDAMDPTPSDGERSARQRSVFRR